MNGRETLRWKNWFWGLNILLGMDTPYKLDKLMPLCGLVEQLSGIPCPHSKPFVGDRNYTRESGIGVDMVIKNPLAMFATDPTFFGKKAEIALGKKSGKASITYFLEQLHKTATDEQVAEILTMVKDAGIEKKHLLTMEEFSEIVDKVL